MSNLRMVLSKKGQREQRRAAVLELAAQGLSQQAIAERLGAYHISSRTVGRDLDYLRRESNEYVKKSRQHLAYQYRLSLTNFYQLRKEAWNHLYQTKNEGIKAHLYQIIRDINNDIMNMLAIEDIIKMEVMVQEAKDRAEKTRQEMNGIVNNHGNKQYSQAVF